MTGTKTLMILMSSSRASAVLRLSLGELNFCSTVVSRLRTFVAGYNYSSLKFAFADNQFLAIYCCRLVSISKLHCLDGHEVIAPMFAKDYSDEKDFMKKPIMNLYVLS